MLVNEGLHELKTFDARHPWSFYVPVPLSLFNIWKKKAAYFINCKQTYQAEDRDSFCDGIGLPKWIFSDRNCILSWVAQSRHLGPESRIST